MSPFLFTKTHNLQFYYRYGLLGKWFKDTFGHTGSSLLSGFMGMPNPEDHGVPYSLTEEFVSVYRMHALLPDSIDVRNIKHPQERRKDESPPIRKTLVRLVQ